MLTGIQLLLRFFLLALLALMLFFGLELAHFYLRPLTLPAHQPFDFEVKPGRTLHQVANDLDQAGVLAHSRFLVLMAHVMQATHRLKAGEYRIKPGQSAHQLLEMLIRGEVILRTITIVPGWTVDKILDEFHQSAYLHHDLKGLTRSAIREQLGISKSSMEGLFWAETYSFARNTDESDILQHAHQMMVEALAQAWQQRDADVPYQDRYQALIVASLVEKETALADERPIIAGVILERIKKNMYLQIDPTVIYALGERYDGVLRKVDLKFKSPYNTYVTKGLPPTPIAVPSSASIEAAMHPDRSGVLYFVAGPDGRHVFTKTLAEHNEAVKKARAARQAAQEAQAERVNPQPPLKEAQQ